MDVNLSVRVATRQEATSQVAPLTINRLCHRIQMTGVSCQAQLDLLDDRLIIRIYQQQYFESQMECNSG